MKNLKALLIVILVTSYVSASAQKGGTIKGEKYRISRLLYENITIKPLKDSTAVYAFAFKVMVSKDANNKIKIDSLTANDDIAFKVFPKYRLLEKFNYVLFMADREEANFIFPVVIEIVGSQENGDRTRLIEYFTDNALRQSFIKNSVKMFYDEDTEKNVYFKPVTFSLDARVTY